MTITNEVVVTFIEYTDHTGGKRRPVLIIGGIENDADGRAYKITSKYANKPVGIRRKYYKIKNWQFCGLRKESWVDTNTVLLPSKLPEYHIIGHLSQTDAIGLAQFLHNQ